MSAKSNYFRLGLFVILGFLLAIGGVIIFGGFQLAPEDLFYIETYYEDSVQGLLEGSKVKMRGVTVGTVEEIGFVGATYRLTGEDNAKYGSWVRIRISIDPVNFYGVTLREMKEIVPERVARGLRIRMASQGVTGGKFVQAEYLDPERFIPFEPPWAPRDTYIPSAEGVIEAMVSSVDQIIETIKELPLDRLVNNIDDLVVTVKKGVEDAQMAELSAKAQRVLDDVHGVVKGPEVTGALADFREISGTLRKELEGARLGGALDDFAASMDSIRETTEELPQMVERLNGSLANLDRFLLAESEDMQALLMELRLTVQNLRELTDLAKRYPAAVLFGNEPAKMKPEEKP
jgi:ABC-type transporter Mla subunit MlaD